MLMLELEVVSMLVLALVLTRRGVVERWGSMSSLQAVGPRNAGTPAVGMPTWTWRGARTTERGRLSSVGRGGSGARRQPGYDPAIPQRTSRPSGSCRGSARGTGVGAECSPDTN
jgi:hypothetical protein